LGRLAACDNVTVKLSGLATEADRGSWSIADLEPVGSRVLELFGADRVMLGSDWPVCELAGPAEQVWAATRARVPQDGLDAALSGTAAATYRLSI
jgi:L-fuconolactonase